MTERGRILIADDEAVFLDSTADLLRREGYVCDGVPDAFQAAQRLAEADYDVLIADIKMPGNSELELVRRLPDRAKGLPVILVTGKPSLHSAIDSVGLPVVAYLVKPLELADLLTHVRVAVAQRRAYQAVSATHARLADWSRELADIARAIEAPSPDVAPVSVSAFLNLTLRNIAGALFDLTHLTGALAQDGDTPPACHLLHCPRPVALLGALREAISVLEKTKTAFKSKELAQLRKKLEGIVAKEQDLRLTRV